MTTTEILEQAAAVKAQAAIQTTEARRHALRCMADEIVAAADRILEANAADVEAARGTVSDVMIDRLILTRSRIDGMADGIRQVAQLPDPVGLVLDTVTRPSGIVVRKVSVPFGVLAIIYESRPNVTSDAAALAVMSGNCCILRCGKEAWNSAKAIVDAIQAGLAAAGLPRAMVQLIEDRTRQSSKELMTAVGLVDLLIPRGGAGLINACVREAIVPCIQTGTGICHIYVDGQADQDMALNIIENAKTSRPSVCNAAEVCVVDRSIAAGFLPRLKQRLVEDRIAAGKQPVEFRCDPETQAIMNGTPASENDFDTEFLDYIMAVKVVSGVEEAVAHIGAHSTHHSDAIITADPKAADLFVKTVDSAAVYVNASTRFTDGGEFGLGCEMGISTQKMHARGPMGLRELTTYKYIVTGEGQIR